MNQYVESYSAIVTDLLEALLPGHGWVGRALLRSLVHHNLCGHFVSRLASLAGTGVL